MIPFVLVVLLSQDAAAAPPDLRSVELVHEECRSRISTRELVYYANGTVRLREGPVGETTLTLGELGQPDAAVLRRQLSEVSFAAVEILSTAPDGDWVESCRLRITLREGEVHELVYSPLDAGSLELDKLRRLLDFLITVARDDGGSIEIPAGYRARLGDRLERADGAVFEVVGFTSDGKAVELMSNSPPLTMYVERDQLRVEFRRLVAPPREP